jgi:hypothetical protein
MDDGSDELDQADKPQPNPTPMTKVTGEQITKSVAEAYVKMLRISENNDRDTSTETQVDAPEMSTTEGGEEDINEATGIERAHELSKHAMKLSSTAKHDDEHKRAEQAHARAAYAYENHAHKAVTITRNSKGKVTDAVGPKARKLYDLATKHEKMAHKHSATVYKRHVPGGDPSFPKNDVPA